MAGSVFCSDVVLELLEPLAGGIYPIREVTQPRRVDLLSAVDVLVVVVVVQPPPGVGEAVVEVDHQVLSGAAGGQQAGLE